MTGPTVHPEPEWVEGRYPGFGHWTYRGMTIYPSGGDRPQFKIHGPNSRGRRARAIVFTIEDAVKKIDRLKDGKK